VRQRGVFRCRSRRPPPPSLASIWTDARSAIISPCPGATDYPGESRSSRNTSIPFRVKRTGFPGTTLPPPIHPRHSPESQGTRPRIVAHPLGAHSVMGQGLVWRCQHDQRTVQNGSHEAGVPRCIEISQVLDSGRRALRVDATGQSQTAIML